MRGFGVQGLIRVFWGCRSEGLKVPKKVWDLRFSDEGPGLEVETFGVCSSLREACRSLSCFLPVLRKKLNFHGDSIF